jgi:hypothetical protein
MATYVAAVMNNWTTGTVMFRGTHLFSEDSTPSEGYTNCSKETGCHGALNCRLLGTDLINVKTDLFHFHE